MGTGGRRDAVDSLNDALDCWVMRNAGRWGVRRGRAGMRFQIYPLVCWQCQRNVSSRRQAAGGRLELVGSNEGETGERERRGK
jgi:hypothetical protein